MARALSTDLDAIMLDATTRSPSWEIQVYDIRSTTDTIKDVVLLNVTGSGSLETLTGPRDITSDTVTAVVTEKRGDYVSGGVQSSSVTLVIADPNNEFDPLDIVGVPTTDPSYAGLLGRFFRQGNVVTIKEGDSRVDSSTWPFTFTGEITGQAGYKRGRSDGAVSQLTVQVLDRAAHFIRFKRTSQEFFTGDSYRFAGEQIGENEMGLDFQEIDFSGWGSDNTFGIISTQFVDEPPIVMIARLGFPDSVLPRFNGLGQLTQFSSLVSKAPDRFYANRRLFTLEDRPASNIENADCVTVIGLDKNQSKIIQDLQPLARTDITTGFFSQDEEFRVYWSEERTLTADNAQARVLRSIFLGSESFEFINNPSSVGGGSIGVIVKVSTGFAPWLIGFLLGAYLAAAWIPDGTVGFFGFGVTIPYGRAAQAAVLVTALVIMTKIGRGQYEFIGEPTEMVYAEIRGRACVEGVGTFDENQIEIENHLINTQALADAVARDQLFLLQAQENVRNFSMLHDLALEPSDIFEVSGNRTFMVEQISYTLSRRADSIPAIVTSFETTDGVNA